MTGSELLESIKDLGWRNGSPIQWLDDAENCQLKYFVLWVVRRVVCLPFQIPNIVLPFRISWDEIGHHHPPIRNTQQMRRNVPFEINKAYNGDGGCSQRF
jgi:hypothetical protein